MIIGLLSDTHDRADTMAQGVNLLTRGGAEFYIHCGDVGGAEILDHLAGLRAAFVFGNTDWDRLELQRSAELLEITCLGRCGDLTLDGKRIAVIHGDNAPMMRQILDAQEHDYLFHGHTHKTADRRVGRTRVINPGALHRTARKTVALLDIAEDHLTVLPL